MITPAKTPTAIPSGSSLWLIALLLAALAGGCSDTATPAIDRHPIAAIDAPAKNPRKAPLDANRKLPAGTLDYTIELTGKVKKNGPQPDYHHVASIHRVLKVSSHMRGDLVNGDLALSNPDAHAGASTAVASPMDDMQQAMEACEIGRAHV